MATLTPGALAPADASAAPSMLPGKAPIMEPIADIPLPPAELVAALDNTGAGAAATAADADEVITLEFVGDDLPEATFKLRFPFRWQGDRIDSVTVRQLTTGQVGKAMGDAQRAGHDAPQLMDLYAVMTGLPAKVLRAMPATDMDPIVEKAFDFLPPYFRPASG